MNPPILHTEFGRAKIDAQGYYTITSRKEGNHRKRLHRLVFEKFHGSIPDKYIVHHKDGDKLNNCILNLELVTCEKHNTLHHYQNDEVHRKVSLAKNNTGYRNVGISKDPTCKQGFIYRYRYSENRLSKSIYSVTIEGLREKVLAQGLPWEKFEEEATA